MENPQRPCRSASAHARRFVLAAFTAAVVASAPAGENAPARPGKDFVNLSIEELMNESVTSVSKKETSLFSSPAAIAVVNQEDLRRLGTTSLPEALRAVPGMNVARINANKWAVSARGFNGQFANKLLVLIDGRTVYTPAFAGVYWDAQDVVLEDVDRIEVIRGPGATLWGANAVNGVINVRTKTAKETQGTLIAGSVGTEDQPGATLRHGGKLAGNLYYRVYAKYFDRDGFVDSSGRPTPDDWNLLRGGARLDWEPSGRDALTLQGEYYDGESGENKRRASLTPPFSRTFDAVGHNRGGHVLGRWTHSFSTVSELTVQGYYDHFAQNRGPEVNQETRDTLDIELQHRVGWAAQHDLVWGAGFRNTRDNLPSNFGLTWIPQRSRQDIVNLFAQDEIALVPERLSLTLGSKFEHNDYTGWEVQPGARLFWTPRPRQAAWAAVARAVRTPSRFERGIRLNASVFQPSPASPPFVVSLFTDGTTDSEKLTSFELGYRFEPTRQLAFDAALFYNEYDDLLRFVSGPSRFETTPAPPHVLIAPSTMDNSQSGETAGAEVSVQWRVSDAWRLMASYSRLRTRLQPDSEAAGLAPKNQAHLRAYVDLPRACQLSAAAYYVDRLPEEEAPGYVRFDLGLTWRPTKALELGVWGQNIFDRQHFEFGTNSTPLRTEVPRTVHAKATWRY